MTLRKRAEAAARETAPCTCHEDYKRMLREDPTCFACAYGEEIADAIEREAKAFAELALREFATVRHAEWWKSEGRVFRIVHTVHDEGPSSPAFHSADLAELRLSEIIAKAIAAAEKEGT